MFDQDTYQNLDVIDPEFDESDNHSDWEDEIYDD